ncbi:MAG: NUDIX domain-containing protein [Solobacterium sp.]|nr:NUDIX domain-containing protein [Solobacterium sp.]MCH4222385.1 NUDIX domain-containing protein [Solobacterium sp.]MCH4265126.1 NUDIX domain-containing protein [Solobacterium sp.]
MTETVEKSCGAVVVRFEDHRLYTLVVRQNDGHWGFPKGHVEHSETEQETAYREVKEETGVEIEFIDGFNEQTHYCPREGVYKDVSYFLARPIGGKEKAQKEEIRELKWMPLVEAVAALTFDNDASLLRHVIRYIKDNDIESYLESL